jgi:hypothetical protein
VITSLFKAVAVAGVVSITTPATVVSTHDFHVSYTRMAVEGTQVVAQIRLFSDDLTRALIERTKAQTITLGTAQSDVAFRAYLTTAFPVTINGRALTPTVVSSGQDKEMWSFVVTWTATAPVTTVTLHNSLLMELFDDQQNIVKVKHIATGKEETLFYSGGSRVDQTSRR